MAKFLVLIALLIASVTGLMEWRSVFPKPDITYQSTSVMFPHLNEDCFPQLSDRSEWNLLFGVVSPDDIREWGLVWGGFTPATEDSSTAGSVIFNGSSHITIQGDVSILCTMPSSGGTVRVCSGPTQFCAPNSTCSFESGGVHVR